MNLAFGSQSRYILKVCHAAFICVIADSSLRRLSNFAKLSRTLRLSMNMIRMLSIWAG
jgi:hypothetical protein